MIYKEWKDSQGYICQEWRNEKTLFHRDLEPARIFLDRDGSIEFMEFWINGEYLGDDEYGFWKLWDGLTSEQRQSCELLKYLVRFS